MDLLRRVVKLLPALIAPAIAVAAVWLWHPTPGQEVLPDYPTAQSERQPQPTAEAVKEIPALVLSRGSLEFPFLAYDTFGPGRIALAVPTREGTVEVMVAQFQRGELEPVSSVQEPMGAVLDVTHGDLLNNGALQAIAVTAEGLLVLEGAETYFKVEESGLERLFVGDWDGDGTFEAAILHQKEGARQVTIMRYGPDGQGTKVGSFPAPDFPAWSAVLEQPPGKPTLLMGAERGEASVQVTFYRIDPAVGLQPTARYPLPQSDDSAVVSFTAGELAGRPTLAIARQARRSYLEFFDTAAEGMPSRGRITLPDSEAYAVLLGSFTGLAESEVLAMDAFGQWVLYGLEE